MCFYQKVGPKGGGLVYLLPATELSSIARESGRFVLYRSEPYGVGMGAVKGDGEEGLCIC